jgi:PleD family two-component response regulator
MADILVVEDDESVCALLETNLLIKGHEISVAHTGSECLEAIEKNTPNLVILDIMLPDSDGFELLEHLRTRPETENVPVLILTARGDEKDRVRGLAAGADDYLVKPFYPTELLLRIDRLLNTRATASSLRKMALTDQLTGLGNRAYFETRLEQMIPAADREEIDLCFFVIDIPSIPEQVRKHGWKVVDMALSKLGAALSRSLGSQEEAFWLGTQGVVISSGIDSAALAQSRLNEIKDVVRETLDNFRQQVALLPYFGFCFYEAGETVAELLTKIAKAPYGRAPTQAPRQAKRLTPEESIERAFGGKLTGLAPVDLEVERGPRKPRQTAGSKLDPRAALKQLTAALHGLDSTSEAAPASRPTTTSAESRTAGISSVESPMPSGGTTDTQPIPALTEPPALPCLDRSAVIRALDAMCSEASAAPSDLAVCCLVFEQRQDAVERLGEKAVSSVLDRVASHVAASLGLEQLPGAQALWDGEALFVAVPSIDVPMARELTKELSELALAALQPHRLQLRVAAAAGYVFFDFEESAQSLLSRALESPRRGGVPITPLQARKRSSAPEATE